MRKTPPSPWDSALIRRRRHVRRCVTIQFSRNGTERNLSRARNVRTKTPRWTTSTSAPRSSRAEDLVGALSAVVAAVAVIASHHRSLKMCTHFRHPSHRFHLWCFLRPAKSIEGTYSSRQRSQIHAFANVSVLEGNCIIWVSVFPERPLSTARQTLPPDCTKQPLQARRLEDAEPCEYIFGRMKCERERPVASSSASRASSSSSSPSSEPVRAAVSTTTRTTTTRKDDPS